MAIFSKHVLDYKLKVEWDYNCTGACCYYVVAVIGYNFFKWRFFVNEEVASAPFTSKEGAKKRMKEFRNRLEHGTKRVH